jgi:hypothetical protein
MYVWEKRELRWVKSYLVHVFVGKKREDEGSPP